MVEFWSISTAVFLTVFNLIVVSVIILSLIPLYIPSSDLIVSYVDNRTRPFIFEFTGNIILNRLLIDSKTVDAVSLPVIQQTIESLLIEWKLPRSMVPTVDMAYVDLTNGILRVNGTFLFSPFCKQTCQNSLMNRLAVNQGQLQIARTIQISIVGGSNYTFILQTVNLINATTDLTNEFELTYTMMSNNGTSLRRLRRRRQTAHGVNYQSVISLVHQTLAQSLYVQDIPFTIENSTWILTNGMTKLYVLIQLQFPINCFVSCRNQSNDDFFLTALYIDQNTNLSYKDDFVSYTVQTIYPFSLSNSAPPSLQILTYMLSDFNSSNITFGPITDWYALRNFSAALNESIKSSVFFEIVSASFEPDTTSRSFSWIQTRSMRRPILYKLVVVISFFFTFSKCDYHCQETTLEPIINIIYISRPPPFFINGIILILPQPTIGTFQKPTHSLSTAIITTTTTPSPTAGDWLF